MNRFLSTLLLPTGLLIGFTAQHFTASPEPVESPALSAEFVSTSPQDPMQDAMKFIQPGPEHEVLKRFAGEWEVELRMPNGKGNVVGKGAASAKVVFGGRFLEMRGTLAMMGQPSETFFLLGHDNMKKSFVMTMTNSMETAMRSAEGDMSRDRKSLVAYGLLDEYLTGEHDKMVKYAWRFIDDDTIEFEVHDLHIGEVNSMVLHQTFKRKKG